MAKLVDVNGLKAVVQKINADTKDIRTLLAGKADGVHEHTAADVKFGDGKNRYDFKNYVDNKVDKYNK